MALEDGMGGVSPQQWLFDVLY